VIKRLSTEEYGEISSDGSTACSSVSRWSWTVADPVPPRSFVGVSLDRATQSVRRRRAGRPPRSGTRPSRPSPRPATTGMTTSLIDGTSTAPIGASSRQAITMDEEEFVELVLSDMPPRSANYETSSRRTAAERRRRRGSVLARVLDSGSRRSSRSHCTFAPYPASLSNVSFETDRADERRQRESDGDHEDGIVNIRKGERRERGIPRETPRLQCERESVRSVERPRQAEDPDRAGAVDRAPFGSESGGHRLADRPEIALQDRQKPKDERDADPEELARFPGDRPLDRRSRVPHRRRSDVSRADEQDEQDAVARQPRRDGVRGVEPRCPQGDAPAISGRARG